MLGRRNVSASQYYRIVNHLPRGPQRPEGTGSRAGIEVPGAHDIETLIVPGQHGPGAGLTVFTDAADARAGQRSLGSSCALLHGCRWWRLPIPNRLRRAWIGMRTMPPSELTACHFVAALPLRSDLGVPRRHKVVHSARSMQVGRDDVGVGWGDHEMDGARPHQRRCASRAAPAGVNNCHHVRAIGSEGRRRSSPAVRITGSAMRLIPSWKARVVCMIPAAMRR